LSVYKILGIKHEPVQTITSTRLLFNRSKDKPDNFVGPHDKTGRRKDPIYEGYTDEYLVKNPVAGGTSLGKDPVPANWKWKQVDRPLSRLRAARRGLMEQWWIVSLTRLRVLTGG
jgi:hypothetical protein